MSIKSLYVHTLDNLVFDCADKSFNQKCCDENLHTDYNPELPALYVGYTGKDVEERIQEHKDGYKSSRWMNKYAFTNPNLSLILKGSANYNILNELDELELGYELAKSGFLVFGPSFGDLKKFNVSTDDWIQEHIKGNYFKKRNFVLEVLTN